MTVSSELTRCLVQKLVPILFSFSSLVIMPATAAAAVQASEVEAALDLGFASFARKPRLEAKKLQEAFDRDSRLPLCSEMIADPARPFHVVWNHPVNCDTKTEPIGFEQYGIDNNSEKKFIGDKIKLYYYAGSWPGYRGDDAINGGLPQTIDPHHYVKTYEDFANSKGPGNFSGLAVIDFEGWRPIFTTNYGSMWVYQVKSIERVRETHPEYSEAVVREEAKKQFEDGAREVFQKTLAIGQDVMPQAFWGYYNYPRYWTDDRATVDVNNRTAWLWRQTTVLLPSIYLGGPANRSSASKVKSVKDAVKEAVRIQATFSRPNTPIYPYSLNQRSAHDFFSEEDLDITLRLPAEMGVSGVVLWGSSGYYRAPNQCQRLRQYVKTVLGPYVRNLTDFMTECSNQRCGGHGRCVRKDLDRTLASSASLGCITDDPSHFHDYVCRCYATWSGRCCEIRNPRPCQQ